MTALDHALQPFGSHLHPRGHPHMGGGDLGGGVSWRGSGRPGAPGGGGGGGSGAPMAGTAGILPFRRGDETGEAPRAQARGGARRILAEAPAAAPAAKADASAGMRLEDGRRGAVRHGSGPERRPQGPPRTRSGADVRGAGGAAGAGARRVASAPAIPPRRARGSCRRPEPRCAAAGPAPPRRLDGRLPGGARRASGPRRAPARRSARARTGPTRRAGLSVSSGFWNTIRTARISPGGRRRAGRAARSCAPIRAVPSSAASSPTTIRANVDLPEPLSPTSAVTAARPASRSTPASARVRPKRRAGPWAHSSVGPGARAAGPGEGARPARLHRGGGRRQRGPRRPLPARARRLTGPRARGGSGARRRSRAGARRGRAAGQGSRRGAAQASGRDGRAGPRGARV